MSDISSSVTSNTIFKSKAQLVLSIALAYAFMGWVGLALAIPPGWASPVFPAAGLALVCALWFGPKVLAGVWLGSVLLNLSHPWWGGTLTPSTAVVALVIATGATLQAWVGSWLVRRWRGSAWQTLEREQDVLAFILLGGVLAGVVSPLIGVTALQVFGVIERAEFLFTIWNWYVGDLLGVLVFAPLTLCLLDRESELWRDRRRIVMPMLLTLGLVALVFCGAARWERQDLDDQLEADSQTVFTRIADRVIAHREVVSSLKHFIEATPDFTFKQFELFTRITLKDNPDIFALSFNDLIVDEKRPAFERMMSRLSPLGSFQITERDAGGELVRAMTRPEYVTVRYIVPLANNQPAIGYDIYSEPVRREAIDRARASGMMAVTAPIRLVQEQRQRVGILELLPVTGAPTAPANEKGERLVGFAVAVVKVDEMIEIATKGHMPADLVFQLIDPHAPGGQGLLYSSGSPAAGNIATTRAAQWKSSLLMGDREWELSAHPTQDYMRQHRRWVAWAVGVAGLLFAALLQILMLGMTGRTSIIRRENEAITERMRAEAALRESEERYRVLFEGAAEGIAVADPGTKLILYANPAYCEMYGYSIEQLNQLRVEDLHPSESVAEVVAEFEAQTRGQKILATNIPCLRKDGSVFFADINTRPVVIADRPVVVGFFTDVTERKREEEALRKANLVVEMSPVVLFRWRAAEGWPVIMVSQNVIQFGYTPEELLSGSVPFASLVHPEDLDRVAREVQEHSASGTDRFQQEYRIVTKNGEVRWVDDRTTVERTTNGQIAHYQGIVIDITERKRAEAALQASEAEHRLLVQHLHAGVVVHGADTRILLANEQASVLLGLSLEQMKGKAAFDPAWSFVREDESPMPLEEYPVNRIMATRQPLQNFTAGINRPLTQDRVWVLINAFPELDEAGGLRQVVVTFVDITERKRMEEERRKFDIQMREVQKLESLGVLAGGIAHDFNNLLTAILGNAELALLKLSPESPAWHYLKAITRASQRAADLCQQMLAYSGKGRFVVTRHDISEIVREMGQMLDVSVSKNAMMRYSLAEGLPAVESDATQIRQVIMNLITNASDALGDMRGVITVTTGVMECDETYLSESYIDDSLPGGTYVYLEVSDTGSGMDAETRRRIFDPFFTTKFIGRGLGLAAVLGIVRGHKGAIKISSKVGKGTTFKVLLPAVEWEPGERVKTAEQTPSLQGGGTILLVDDDPFVRDVASDMLAKLGFHIVTASNGREGLKIFRTHEAEITCVILDLTMPEMGGEETFRELRNVRSDVRVILSSGYNEQDATQRFVGRGLSGFIQKPYTIANLRNALNRALG